MIMTPLKVSTFFDLIITGKQVGRFQSSLLNSSYLSKNSDESGAGIDVLTSLSQGNKSKLRYNVMIMNRLLCDVFSCTGIPPE